MNGKPLGRIAPSLSKTLLSALLMACAVCAPVAAAAQSVAPRMVVFGGSLSDGGNLFALQKQNNVPPSYDLDATPPGIPPTYVPNSAYARGGHHLSNGPTWAEQYAKARGWAPDAAPAFASSDPRAGNFAVASARARSNSATPNVHMAAQVGAFLQRSGGSAPNDALYIIDFGGNDVRDALFGAGPQALADALQSIASNLSTLYGAGARHFLVLNVPNISFLPSVVAFGPAAVEGALQATQFFNQQLEGVLGQFDVLPGIHIHRFDLFAATSDLHDNPASYGLTNVVAPCITPDVAPYFCQNPDEYFFWDGIHPTRAVHAILAQKVFAATN
jgi:phospholipase/lecithinase/hemolysin